MRYEWDTNGEKKWRLMRNCSEIHGDKMGYSIKYQ